MAQPDHPEPSPLEWAMAEPKRSPPAPAPRLKQNEEGSRPPSVTILGTGTLGRLSAQNRQQLPRVSQGYLARRQELPGRSDPLQRALSRVCTGRGSCPRSFGRREWRGGARRLPGAGQHGRLGAPWATATHCWLALARAPPVALCSRPPVSRWGGRRTKSASVWAASRLPLLLAQG